MNNYKTIKKLIETKQFDNIKDEEQYTIIKNTDLKNYLIEIYLNYKYNKSILKIENILKTSLGKDIFSTNNQLKEKYLKTHIYINFKDAGFISETASTNQIDNQVTKYLTNIKNYSHPIKGISTHLKKDDIFINYCLDNNNLSILNCKIPYKKEYEEKALKLIQEGYKITLSPNIDINYKKTLIKPLLLRGYLDNFNAIDKSQKEELLPILISHIKQGKEYKIDKKSSSLFEEYKFRNKELSNTDNELIDLLIEKNQLDFLEVIPLKCLKSKMPTIINKIRSGIKLNTSFFKIDDDNLLKAFLETNQLQYMLNVTDEIFDKNLELFKTKLKSGAKFSISNSSFNDNNDSIKTKFLKYIRDDKELLKLVMDSDKDNLLILMKIINNLELEEENISEDETLQENNLNIEDLYNKQFYEVTKEYLTIYYGLNPQHLDIFINKLGYQYLKYIKNINIRNAINLDDTNFKKYLELFSYEKLKIKDIENIYDSIIQTRFKIDKKNDLDRLEKIKDSLVNKSLPVPYEELNILSTRIDNQKLLKQKVLNPNEEELLNNPYEFLLYCYNQIKQNNDIDKYLSILYQINRDYLQKEREIYRANHNYHQEIKLDFQYDEQSIVNSILKDLVLNNRQLISYDQFILLFEKYESLANLNSLSKPTTENINKINECLEFLRTGNPTLKNKETLTNINKLKDIIREIIKLDEYYSYNLDECNYNIKKNYIIPNQNDQLFKFLGTINPFELTATVFNNEEVYQSLKRMIQKYKFPDWGQLFNESLELSNLSITTDNLSSIINKYNELNKYIKRKSSSSNEITLPEILRFSNILTSSSNRYNIMFDKENATLIKLNPPPYEAPTAGFPPNYRLEKSLDNLVKSYQRTNITTPPINKDIMINGKMINVNLGNFTNPINLTYGERTGSCMRINGTGNSLYNFCQDNINAFHIRLTDPKTNNFITRVSGFRNGNSIFLNQLRNSLIPSEYPDEDIIEALKKISELIIEQSKESNFPIDNVFISPLYAMSKSKETIINLNEDMEDIKEEFSPFWFDLKEKAIVLATTANNETYIPIEKDINNLPKYKVLRDNPRHFTQKEEIFNQVNKIYLLNQMLQDNNPKIIQTSNLIPEEKIENITYLITGEDWLVCLDKNLEIHEFIIPRSESQINQATLEVNIAKKEIMKKREEYYPNETRNR